MTIITSKSDSHVSGKTYESKALAASKAAVLTACLALGIPGVSHSAGARWRPDGFDVGFVFSSKEQAARAMAEHTCEVSVNPGGHTSCEVLGITFLTVYPLYATYTYTFRTRFAGYLDEWGRWYPDSYQTHSFTRAALAAPVVDRFHYDNVGQCPKFGNPIFPLSGLKKQEIDLYRTGTGLDLKFNYDTRSFIGALPDSFLLAGFLGQAWYSSLHKEVLATAYSRGVAEVRFLRGDGNSTNFALSADQLVAHRGAVDAMAKLTSGWRYYDRTSGVVETYGQSGKILSSASIAGGTLTYFYSDAGNISEKLPVSGLLMLVRDSFGRQISFEYQRPSPQSDVRISAFVDPAGLRTSIAYDGYGNVERLQWPDGFEYKMLYDRPDLPWALTGLIDEDGHRIAEYGYSQSGLATATAHAGEADGYGVTYAAPPSFSVTEDFDPSIPIIWRDHYWQPPVDAVLTMPNGQTSRITSESIGGTPKATGQSQPAGSGCAAASSFQSYDQGGNMTQIDDFAGNRSCFSYVAGRRLEASRVEGLTNGTGCASVISAGAVIPAGSRRTTRQWHPDWRLESKVAEPGRIITNVYNGQPDPFNGNAVASCAPATALLPDGKAIVVRCRSVEQPTTDANGALGFSAALQGSVEKREHKWTYNQFGQVLTHDGPRTDVSDITVFAYYNDTTAARTSGDLASMTNALGKVTTYSRYDKHGQLLESVDPNAVVTKNIYDMRRRLLGIDVGGQTTSYTYSAAGQLTRLALPNGQWLGYEYDDAYRLKAIHDNRGNRIEYTLDNAGNRTAEKVMDPSGLLRRQIVRSMDALGRVQQTIGRN